ncbi:MAG: type I DNA topoisomerase [Bryobacterales bacterium]|nr:type I DNA topoisomerase [Bryobacterales bacterium]
MAASPKTGEPRVLVIVESPTKARTIAKFLPKGFVVKASVGHVRDLPNNATEVPAKYKKEPWGRLGVNVEGEFEPVYVVPKGKKDLVKEMKAAVRKADLIYFATDEDREGESISWHLHDVLGSAVPYKRLVFHEITKTAIRKALASPREINQDLVRAQETRRIVDRLFGYGVSPLLWKKMIPKLSAGRVQSVAVRLMVERERARQRFTKASFWGLKARFAKDGLAFEADLVELAGARVAAGKDFDPDTGALKASAEGSSRRLLQLGSERAREVEEAVRASSPAVASAEEKAFSASPQPPYVTSTLQQEANSKLRFQARHTMRLAQQLYENGFITYMRTDSTVLSDEAKTAARNLIVERFGREFLSEDVRYYRNKVKNVQEAHEAIRPAGGQFRAIDEVRTRLGAEAAKLYEMIWRRTLASQMPDARGTISTVLLDAGEARFRAAGKTIEFAGFLKAYSAEAVPGDSPVDANERLLPKLSEGDGVTLESVEASQRHTQPPQRFTEGSLIRELERLGIGRPSTWSTIVDLVQSRAYASRRGTVLVPTFTAMAVVSLLETHFTRLTDYEFTAELEDQLDAIARGELGRLEYLRSFYFGNGFKGLRTLIEDGEADIDPRKVCALPVGKREDGTYVEVRIGRYGPFLSDGTARCSVPEELSPDELDLPKATELLELAGKGLAALGVDPQSNLPVYLKQGRYGPFVQLGEAEGENGSKRASLLRGMSPESVDIEVALKLLSLPRELGIHPENGQAVVAANGRYGPFVRCDQEVRSIPATISPLEISLEQALDLLNKQKPASRRPARAELLTTLGTHPETGAELKVMLGRYGPYVTDGEVNASVPQGTDPEGVTVDQAVELLRARAARIAEGGGFKRRTRAKRS